MALSNDNLHELYLDEDLNLSKLVDSDANSSFFNSCDYYSYENLTDIKFINADLKVLHINIRSFLSKLDQLILLLNELESVGHKIDVILLCETFITKLNITKCKINGYNLTEYFIREQGSRGGVAIFTKKGLKCIPRTDLMIYKEGLYESCFIELITDIGQKNIIVGEFYRIPGTNEKDFLHELDKLLRTIDIEQKELLIGSDQNIDLLKINTHNNSSELLEICLKSSVIPTIIRPTRITHSTSTLIDNLFISSNLTKNYKSGIILSEISDHFACFIMITNSKKINKTFKEFKSRKLNKTKLSRIKETLRDFNWNELEYCNTETAYDKFETVLFHIMNKHAPEKIFKIKHNDILSEPWMTKGLLISSRRIYKLYTKSIKKSKGDSIYDKYIEQRNKLRSLKRKAKLDHFRNLLNEYRNDSKRLWSTINSLTGKIKNKNDSLEYITINGIKNYNKQNIANGFCDFFSNIGNKLASNIDKSNKSYKDFMSTSSSNSVFLHPTNKYEIEKIINSLKNKTSFGSDKISNSFIKSIKSEICHPLEIIFNKSMLEGKFPSKFKIAHVLPVFKNNNKHDCNNYRPISLLTCISKILEKLVHNRIYTFLEQHKLLNPLQFGFRKGHNTIDAITCFFTKLLPKLDQKEYNIGVFVDLSKAFDSIDHNILLYKLEKLGIRGIAKTWFEDYITDRKQCVRLNKENTNDYYYSKLCNISHGVPQGSILGPILFLIYISDMTNSIKHGTAISFADDTTLIISDKSFEDLYSNTYEDINSLIDFLNANKLSINLNKTKYILFKPNLRKVCNLNKEPKLIINNTEIKQVDKIKFLGLHIDSKINWIYQVNSIISKLKQSEYIFRSCKTLLPLHCKKLLYYAHVASHLSYGSLIWAPMINNTQLEKIKKCIDKILLYIKNVRMVNHRNLLYKELKILNFEDTIELELSKFMYKITNNMTPFSIHEAFRQEPGHYNTRNRNTPRIIQHTTNLFNKSFMAKCTSLFTRLPQELKQYNNIKSFSKNFTKSKLANY